MCCDFSLVHHWVSYKEVSVLAINDKKKRQKSLREIAKQCIFTTGDAARLCNVSQQTIIRSFDSGRLKGWKVPGSKFRRILREELIRFMKANDIPLGQLGQDKKHNIVVFSSDTKVRSQVGYLATGDDSQFNVEVVPDFLEALVLLAQGELDLLVLDCGSRYLDSLVKLFGKERSKPLPQIKIIAVWGDGDLPKPSGSAGLDVAIFPKDLPLSNLTALIRSYFVTTS